MDLPLRALRAIAGSKKAVAAIATVLFVFLAPVLDRIGVTVTADELEKVIAIAIAYLIGQGIADAGKERAKIEAQVVAAAPATSTSISGELPSR